MTQSEIPNALLEEHPAPPAQEVVLERFRTGLFARLENSSEPSDAPDELEESASASEELNSGVAEEEASQDANVDSDDAESIEDDVDAEDAESIEGDVDAEDAESIEDDVDASEDAPDDGEALED